MSENDNRRKWVMKDWVQLIMVSIAVAGIFWRGGQFTSELVNIGLTVAKIDARQEAFATQQAQDRSDLRVLQERYTSLEARIRLLEK